MPKSSSTHTIQFKNKLVSKAIAQKMLDLLCNKYPNAHCELDFQSDFQLLIAVILSAQCTDAQVNKVTATLFTQFPTAQTLARASLEEIKAVVRPTGYYNAK
ncbi:MAG: endonuclease III, partial [Candidatus Melainabacteria bacterium]|nr:endonuclease III [Candidatus Melainabacteria bacterium]